MTESLLFLKRISHTPHFTIFWRPHPSLKQKGVLASFIHSILPYLINFNICDVLLNLVPFVQFKKHKKNTHGGVLFSVLKVTLLRGCFSRFLNCTNGTNATHHILL